MPGGRVPKNTRNDPGNKPDKGLEGGGQHHIAPPGPTPKPAGPASIAGMEKFEPVAFDQVAGGPGNAAAGHGGHGKGTGAVDAGFAKESRGIHDASGLFAAQKGHSPKRSAGTKTPTDMETRRKLSVAEGG
jgi:hypothetical protein